MGLVCKMRKIRVEAKKEGLQLSFKERGILSGEQLEIKIDQRWIFGTYIFDPNTNSHYLEAMDQRRYQIDIDSQLRFTPIPLNFTGFCFLVIWFVAVIGDLMFYLKQKLNNQKSK